jgi:hypothetical protein
MLQQTTTNKRGSTPSENNERDKVELGTFPREDDECLRIKQKVTSSL